MEMDKVLNKVQHSSKKREGLGVGEIILMLDIATMFVLVGTGYTGRDIREWIGDRLKSKQKQEAPATDEMKNIFEKEMDRLKLHRIMNPNGPFPEIVFRRGPGRNQSTQNAKGIKIV